MNTAGVVVGTSETVHGAPHAFVWTASDGMIDLNDLLPPGSRWTLETAMEIDDAGVVRGVGLHREHTSVFEIRVELGVRRRPSDLTGDGRVDGADVARLLGRWGACDACTADLDGDGAVGFDDLATLLRGVRDP